MNSSWEALLSKLIIYGNGKMAAMLYQYLKHDYDVVCFTVDEVCVTDHCMADLPVIPFERVASHYDPSEHSTIIAVGFVEMNDLRERKYREASALGYSFINYIHSSVVLHDDLVFGDNIVILDHVSLHPGTTVGNSTFIASGSVVGHCCSIGDSCWISSGVSVAGECKIGPGCFLGINSSIGHGVRLGAKTFVGANTLITKDTGDGDVYISETGQKFRLKSDAFLRFARLP